MMKYMMTKTTPLIQLIGETKEDKSPQKNYKTSKGDDQMKKKNWVITYVEYTITPPERTN